MSSITHRMPAATALTLVALLGGGLLVPCGWACQETIRDSGFNPQQTVPYRLYYFVSDKTPEKDHVAPVVIEASDSLLAESNVVAKVVNLDRPEQREAIALLDSVQDQRVLPAALLASPDGRAMLLPEMRTKEQARTVLQQVISSPKREEIKAHLVKSWCVVVLAEGSDAAANRKARQVFAEASADMKDMLTEGGEVVESRPHLVAVSSRDTAERILLWSLGLEENGDEPQVVVLYGLGRPLPPTLKGDEITRENLYSLFEALGAACTCTAAPVLMGAAPVPMCLSDELKAEIQRREELEWGGLPAEVAPMPPSVAAQPKSPAPQALSRKQASSRPVVSPPFYRQAGRIVAIAIAGMGVVVALAAVALLVRRRRM